MATERTAAEISSRFIDEQGYIQRFIAFLHSRAALRASDIYEAHGVLRSWKLPYPKVTFKPSADDPPLTQAEIREVVESLGAVMPAVAAAIHQYAPEVERLAAEADDIQGYGNFGEWVDYLYENVADRLLDKDAETILRDVHQRWETERSSDDDEFDAGVVGLAMTYTAALRATRKLNALRHAQQKLQECEMLARVARPEAEINVHRQGFILLMTAFDAAIFDLVRVALRRKFFSLVAAFSKQDRLSLLDLSQADRVSSGLACGPGTNAGLPRMAGGRLRSQRARTARRFPERGLRDPFRNPAPLPGLLRSCSGPCGHCQSAGRRVIYQPRPARSPWSAPGALRGSPARRFPESGAAGRLASITARAREPARRGFGGAFHNGAPRLRLRQ
jgi:hypothetical protein